MRLFGRISVLALLSGCFLTALGSGCNQWRRARQYAAPPGPPAPLGVLSDDIWQKQETHGESNDFIMYQHEFVYQQERLNMGGEDHLKKIALRLHKHQDFPVVVERSMTTVRDETEYKYPVHPNPKLDMRRRQVVVRALSALGVPDAEQRVVVAPRYRPGFKGPEAQSAYQEGLNTGLGGYNGGVGSGFGAFGGFGGFGF